MQKQFRGADRRRTNFAPRRRQPVRRNAPKNTIHPSKFINKAVAPEAEAPYQPVHSFHDFGLNSRIAKNLDYLGFKKPSEIQDRCIPISLKGTDTIGLANTGTGKTAAFLLPIIDKIKKSYNFAFYMIYFIIKLIILFMSIFEI